MIEELRRVKDFRKIPAYGSQIFACINCGKERIYGYTGTPENTVPLILCEGSCKGYTIHKFIRTHYGREERC